MYAVLKSGGKQYRVEPGKVFKVGKVPGEIGKEILLKDIMMVSDNDDAYIGEPLLEDFWVRCRIVEQGRSRKVIVFKYKRRKGYRRKRGHKQHFTALRIEEIGRGDPSKTVLPETEEPLGSTVEESE